MNQGKDIVRIIYDALTEKKGEEIKVVDISEISVMADYFVITNGNNSSQVDALVENVEEKMQKAGKTVHSTILNVCGMTAKQL